MNFISEHKNAIIAGVTGALFGALAALLLLAGIMFGYYQVSPQEAVDIVIKQADIKGTKEDGSKINGFIIQHEDGAEYLVTDYWMPIQMNDSVAEAGQ